ncbi:MAG TPA: DUF5676 family membrane protein [Burkholderiales bacterium]|nr:DUF5676 family membrane protein [Burkholderiales bacterium]
MRDLYWRDVGIAMGLFLSVTYVFCVAYDLLLDQHMYEAWMTLLPGFTWISWGSFFIGLVESFAYGIYFGLVFVPLYNALQRS